MARRAGPGTTATPLVRALVLMLAALLMREAHGHGYLQTPVSRNLYAYQVGAYYCPHCGQGGGTGREPGVCGDPFQDNPAINFATDPRFIRTQATYTQGAVINVEVFMSTNHGGRMSMRVCPLASAQMTRECFGLPENQLVRVDNGKLYWYLYPNDVVQSKQFRLPPGVSCAGGCVLQWWWLGYQNCAMPCESDSIDVPGECGKNLVAPGNPNICQGATYQERLLKTEQYYNCADIVILPGNVIIDPPSPTRPPTPASPPSPPAPPPPPPGGNLAAWQQCGGKSSLCGTSGYGPCVDAAWSSPSCGTGLVCARDNEWWWMCVPAPPSPPAGSGVPSPSPSPSPSPPPSPSPSPPPSVAASPSPPPSSSPNTSPAPVFPPPAQPPPDTCAGTWQWVCVPNPPSPPSPNPPRPPPLPPPPSPPPLSSSPPPTGSGVGGTIALWLQCGGRGGQCAQAGFGPCVDASWTSPTCAAGSCVRTNEWWWMCTP